MSSNNSNVYLKKARYGKDLVRLMRVYKEGNVQHCTELTVSIFVGICILEGKEKVIHILFGIGNNRSDFCWKVILKLLTPRLITLSLLPQVRNIKGKMRALNWMQSGY